MFLQNIRKQTIFYEQSIIIVSIKTEQGGPMKKGYIQVYTGDGKGKQQPPSVWPSVQPEPGRKSASYSS